MEYNTWLTQDLPDEALHGIMGQPRLQRAQHTYSIRVFTPAYLHSVALETRLNPLGPQCRNYYGILPGLDNNDQREVPPSLVVVVVVWTAESTFLRIIYILSIWRSSVLGPWRSSPYGSRDRSTNGRGVLEATR